jgi:hypothetical protein
MKKLVIAATIVLASVGVAGVLNVVQADPPWGEKAMGPWVSARVNYSVSALGATVAQADAIRSARKFGQGADGGQVHSVRLATFDHPMLGPRLVWVIDIDGLSLTGIGGNAQHPGPEIKRAVMLVSASEPDVLVAMYSLSD